MKNIRIYIYLLVAILVLGTVYIFYFYKPTVKKQKKINPKEFTKQFYKKIDLNGDGKKEKIEVVHKKNRTFLYVNGKKIENIRWNPHNFYKIVDIDKNDKYLEIETYPPSGVKYFYYDGKQIVALNEILSDKLGSLIIDGSGIIKNKFEGRLIKNIFYEREYRLTSNRQLIKIDSEYGEKYHEIEFEVKLKDKLPLLKSPTEHLEVATLMPGEAATILATDNKEWCFIKSTNGKEGWFAMRSFHIIKGIDKSIVNVFEGLYKPDKVVDLNGDGIDDEIYFIGPPDNGGYIIVNDTHAAAGAYDYHPTLTDLDVNDNIKEIAVYGSGFSCGYTADFYYYDGSGIYGIGHHFSAVSPIRPSGSGIVVDHINCDIFYTCYLYRKYKLNKNHYLEEIPVVDYYEAYPYNLKLKVDLPLQKSREDDTIAFVIKKDEHIKLIGTDNKKWMHAENKDGEKGWFALYENEYVIGLEKHITQIFDGFIHREP